MTHIHNEYADHWSLRTCMQKQPHALLAFSGACGRDSLQERLERLGWQVTAYDQRIGGRGHDLTNPVLVEEQKTKISMRMFDFVYISPPCKSFSIAAADNRPQTTSPLEKLS